MLERNPHTNRYTISYGAMQVGAVTDHSSLVRRVRPALRELLELAGTEERWVGRPLAVHASSSGKILLALLPPAERAGALSSDLSRYTPTTITDRVRLERELQTAREQGYATVFGEDVPYSNGPRRLLLTPMGGRSLS